MTHELDTLMKKLVNSWNEYDKQARQAYSAARTRDDFAKWFADYGKSEYAHAIGYAWDVVAERNEKKARDFCEALEQNVVAITGEITGWSESHTEQSTYSYVITGKNGKAKLSQIYAGGYNVVRLHIRNTVKKIA